MPRAIVFIKGKNWDLTKKKLEEIITNNENFVKKYATVPEFFIEAFGNPDFILSLWSTNLELLKSSIIFVRKFCRAKTSTIVGVESNEREIIEKELKEVHTATGEKKRKQQILEYYASRENARINKLKKILS